MKKFLALALAVLAVAAAQAVTIKWTANLKNGSGTVATNDLCGMAVLTNHVDITKDSSNKLWKIISWDSTTNTQSGVGYKANTDEGKNGTVFIEQIEVNGTDIYATPTMEDGVFKHTTTFDVETDSDGKLALLFFNKQTQGATIVNVTLNDFGANAVYDINLGDLQYLSSNSLASRDETASNTVPEPTALALLALGVAGLALKRKHA